jgi:hypothetical protein
MLVDAFGLHGLIRELYEVLLMLISSYEAYFTEARAKP